MADASLEFGDVFVEEMGVLVIFRLKSHLINVFIVPSTSESIWQLFSIQKWKYGKGNFAYIEYLKIFCSGT